MTQTSATTRAASAPETPVKRQLIVCGVAIAIMSLGVWSLWNEMAPYHPDSYSAGPGFDAEEVSRDGGSLTAISD
ncbi:hypothetical protein ABMC89_12485 [Sulfitobacter sp. HNIBRBA3233]|uniref:hypothetical protein n=1 Tax=Sulfitobacter marinivivus TaxID=3158558 RepID=UPI0032DF7C94